jgi:hypothetical protein
LGSYQKSQEEGGNSIRKCPSAASALLGGLLTLAFYHFRQGATIVAVLIIIYTDWIIGRMKDQLLVRRWL